MQAIRIQLIVFLELVLLASLALVDSNSTLKCPNPDPEKSGDVCDLIVKLQTGDEANTKRMEYNENNMGTFKTSLQEQVTEVRESVEEYHETCKKDKKVTDELISGILARMDEMQEAVTTIENEKNEIRKNISLSLDSLRLYVNDRFEVLTRIEENVTSNVKTLETSLARLQDRLKNYANVSSLSKLDDALRKHENVSSSARIKLLLRVERLEETLKDIPSIKKALQSLTSGVNGNLLNDNPNAQNETICNDTLPTQYCGQIVAGQHCNDEQLRKQCCESCKNAGK